MDPVNPNASPEARALLKLLYAIRGKYTLSGQHEFLSTGDTYLNTAREIGGKTPLVWGADFSFAIAENTDPKPYHHCGPLNLNDPKSLDPGKHTEFLDVTVEQQRESLMDRIREKHAAGHIITLMWHHPFPTWGDTAPGNAVWTFEDRPSAEEWEALTTPGTELYEAWAKQADNIARYLTILRDEKIPVLWRPYHEMNGIWFWWCKRPGPDGFCKLYRQLFDRFVNHHGLNNLLWVWNANSPRDIPGDEAFPYDEYFPGLDVADVLGADVYARDYRQTSYNEIVELAQGKPIALAEVGHVPDDAILKAQPNWSWFMPWGYFISGRASSPKKIRELYESPRVLGLEDREKLDALTK